MPIVPIPDLTHGLQNCAGCGIKIRFSYAATRWTVAYPEGIPVEFHTSCTSPTHDFHWPTEETR